jgi:hypothetical protein
MAATVPKCRRVTVHTFLGDRGALARRVRKMLDDEMHGRAPGPLPLECLLYAGHTGVSTDEDRAIYGFNPDTGATPIWQVMQGLRNGDAFPGIVRDDSVVFAAARKKRLKILTFDVIVPDPGFQTFDTALSSEKNGSQYTYGFPNGDGDCNCTTWLERLGLPLLTGNMDEFTALPGFLYYPRRRFGQCI